MKKKISNAALNRIITAQKVRGTFNAYVLNFSKAQARFEGLTEQQVTDAHQAFCDYHGSTVTKPEMVEVVYAAIAETE